MGFRPCRRSIRPSASSSPVARLRISGVTRRGPPIAPPRTTTEPGLGLVMAGTLETGAYLRESARSRSEPHTRVGRRFAAVPRPLSPIPATSPRATIVRRATCFAGSGSSQDRDTVVRVGTVVGRTLRRTGVAHARDQITHFDGTPLKGNRRARPAISLMRGPEGTEHLDRCAATPACRSRVTLRRAIIIAPTVTYRRDAAPSPISSQRLHKQTAETASLRSGCSAPRARWAQAQGRVSRPAQQSVRPCSTRAPIVDLFVQCGRT